MLTCQGQESILPFATRFPPVTRQLPGAQRRRRLPRYGRRKIPLVMLDFVASYPEKRLFKDVIARLDGYCE
jgi:hypothetical protein